MVRSIPNSGGNTRTHTAKSNLTEHASAMSQSRSNPTAAWVTFWESGSLNIEVCNLTEGILGGWRDGEKGGREPPAAGFANLLSSHWRCYRERGRKSSAADSHVISYFLLACSFLAGRACESLHVENVLHQ